MGSFLFSKEERLLNRKEFVNLNQSGKRKHTVNFKIIYEQNRLGITRLGITATKRTGNAVKRNRIKRLVREFFRLHKKDLPQGLDLVIVAKKGASGLNFREVEEELSEFILD